jgi:hypothetical protein
MIVLLLAAGLLTAQSSPVSGRALDNPYLAITILPGWTVEPSVAPALHLIKGKYLLTINPVFTHASGVEGGRFSEIVEGMPSLDAVTANVDQPAGGAECTLEPSDALKVTDAMSLGNLYTDSSKTGNGCVFPASGPPAWFGSFSGGDGPESEYTITLSYNSADVNSLPKKGSPELKQVFAEVVATLKTLRFKPPIVVSKVSPESAAPGATVTIYGSGFNISKANVIFSFVSDDLNVVVAENGRSLTFEVPTSIETVSCQEGHILIGGFCLPTPPGQVDVNDCPRKSDDSSNFCRIPIPPATYQLLIDAGGVTSPPIPFAVTAQQPRPVSISLMYPAAFVSAGNLVTVRGGGFARTGNSVRIGDAVVKDIPSADGKTITFRAPEPSGKSFIDGMQFFKAFVVNANGESNSMSVAYQ